MVNYFLSFLIVLLLLTISWTDLTKRVINNKAVIALFFLIVPFSYFFYGNIFVLNGIVALIVGFVLFQFGIFGGGDVKLLSVLLLAVPTEQIIPLLFFISIIGFLLIIIGFLFFRKLIREKGLPYGIAISGGFLSVIWMLN